MRSSRAVRISPIGILVRHLFLVSPINYLRILAKISNLISYYFAKMITAAVLMLQTRKYITIANRRPVNKFWHIYNHCGKKKKKKVWYLHMQCYEWIIKILRKKGKDTKYSICLEYLLLKEFRRNCRLPCCASEDRICGWGIWNLAF